ncbi:hypothetical protein SAMN05421874_128121 [Nonomuraea maritima]|uniref:Uncharacterized protein n=1 Tax=Nonomuraea maritima TaxID=683260 RepID=A0A1G9MNU3_9ACTN|nr:hypothetical protein [Nonomuraea maritima]SDL75952.1 hypothetical protein SAMN05421874_128121 [Nonomuraea maritima]
MRDQLVATGDQYLDAFLLLSRGMRYPQRQLEDAETSLREAQKRDHTRNGFHGTAERRQRAEKRYDEAKRELDIARRIEDQADRDIRQTARPQLLALVDAEIEALWGDFYTPRDTTDWRTDPMPDDPTAWWELQPGAEVHIRYATTGVRWQFIELGEPHPDAPGMRIARYVERSEMRGVAVVELAVHPEQPVGRHARSTQMTITQPTKEEQV